MAASLFIRVENMPNRITGKKLAAAFSVLPMGPRLGDVVLDDRSMLTVVMVGLALATLAAVGMRFSFSSPAPMSPPFAGVRVLEANERN